MAVLLKADAMVNPPINNMIVGENMTEKMNLAMMRMTQTWGFRHLLGGLRCCQTSNNTVLIRPPYHTQTDQKQGHEY